MEPLAPQADRPVVGGEWSAPTHLSWVAGRGPGRATYGASPTLYDSTTTVTVGLDVDAHSIGWRRSTPDELLEEWTLPTAMRRSMRALRRWPVACRCYEAGPTGFGLNFPLNTGHRSETFFPLRTAKNKPGDRREVPPKRRTKPPRSADASRLSELPVACISNKKGLARRFLGHVSAPGSSPAPRPIWLRLRRSQDDFNDFGSSSGGKCPNTELALCAARQRRGAGGCRPLVGRLSVAHGACVTALSAFTCPCPYQEL